MIDTTPPNGTARKVEGPLGVGVKVSASLLAWIGALRIYQGPLRGERFEVLEWQRELLRLFDTPGDISMTCGRKNGKTTFVSAICAAAIAGPLAEPWGEVVVVAPSFKQSITTLRGVKAFLGDRLADRKRWIVRDSQNVAEIVDRETGAGLYCLASNNPDSLHGRQPTLTVLDESAGFKPTVRDRVWQAVKTSAGAHGDNSRVLMIGTRPANAPEHFFERALDGDRAVRYAADPEDDPFDLCDLGEGEPEYSTPSPVFARSSSGRQPRPLADPLELPGFRSAPVQHGSQSDQARALLTPIEDWTACETDDPPARAGPYVLGVDLVGWGGNVSGWRHIGRSVADSKRSPRSPRSRPCSSAAGSTSAGTSTLTSIVAAN